MREFICSLLCTEDSTNIWRNGDVSLGKSVSCVIQKAEHGCMYMQSQDWEWVGVEHVDPTRPAEMFTFRLSDRCCHSITRKKAIEEKKIQCPALASTFKYVSHIYTHNIYIQILPPNASMYHTYTHNTHVHTVSRTHIKISIHL